MTTDELLTQVAENVRNASYVPGTDVSNEECIGVAIAQYFGWDSRFLDVVIAAAEESNFHTFGAMVEDYKEKLG